MPGVAVLPNSPGLGGFGTSKWRPISVDGDGTHFASITATQNGFARSQDDMSVGEIKSRAREAVKKEARGASALTLIRTARSQVASGKDYETQGDLKGALGAFAKAASLAQMAMNTSEFQAEAKGKVGVLRKEFSDFIDGADLTGRITALEEKLKAIEKVHPAAEAADSDNRPISKPGGSIADRMKALQDNGLTISTTKRHPFQNGPTTPGSSSPNRFSQAVPITPTTTMSPSTPIPPSPHSFVSPSTLGPPSPPPTPPPVSPRPSNLISDFNNNFPSIDELDENPAFTLPSVPTGLSNGSNKSSPKDTNSFGSLRNFVLPIERPSSTPITPTMNNFASRPVSPSKPTVPLKPSGLSVNHNGPSKSPLPNSNTAFPKELLGYIRDHHVLLIDVRERAKFEKEHIKGAGVICIEPLVLARSSLTADGLEDAMSLLPAKERPMFNNRDKFDLVVVYDDNSTSFGDANSPLSVLIQAIFERAFKKILKRNPMMLIGGFEAWKRDVGDNEIVKGDRSTLVEAPKPMTPSTSMNSVSSPPLGYVGSNNPFANGLSSAPISPEQQQHQLWTPPSRSRAETNPPAFDHLQLSNGHRPNFSLDQTSMHSRSPAEINYPSISMQSPGLTRRPAISRAALSATSGSFSPSIPENMAPATPLSPSLSNGASSINYPQFPPRASAAASGSFGIASPPQASINPSLSRRHSLYIDQSHEALSSLNSSRPSIDYPELSSQQILRPPPAAASGALERQDNRPRQTPFSPLQSQTSGLPALKSARIPSDYPVTYWLDIQIGTSGLKNLGNTCYMNAPIQCLSATVPFARFFTDGRWKNAINYTNAMGTKGKLAGAFAQLVHDMWGGDLPYLTPMDFRKTICQLKSQYIGTDQHDSQEFLSFLLDGIHEDLNRILSKPVWAPTPEQEAELERLPPHIAVEQEWKTWKTRNDSIIVDYFQGQFRSRLECLTCHKTSTTYNVFSILQLPIPHGRSGKVPLQRCLEALFNTEILEKDDAWDCPQCKVKRKATKQLSLARLPPILLIHLKRFEANGRFSDKVDTFVDFPIKSLDLTNFMPSPLPPGVDKGQFGGPTSPDDPRTQLPPYKYDLYGVTNHIGNLSSGHYTAFVASRGGWMYCDDSSVKPIDSKQVVGQRAYVLFYKRSKV
ncbi:ubiquitin carboxyl-terminal hydrolase 4 [Mycena floridula]|nr:ubiquitin carboxyl-terminal hydrolase 4 [Mycena floridula]